MLSVRCLQNFQLSEEHVDLEMKTRYIGLENIYAKMIMKTMDMNETDCGGQVE